ncbi:Steroid 17-alpha-hydroxylase/17,20 lyase [Stylophora pistillata]|uniref:Steroid 17-alpha-hydroxylase/17,20 lyase n=1 Tax=Stylophora pistillata TaxID=50429 RepID=A0A2B4RAM4_STYPI|nr:Steroid 17-alpha-hydroxylase/17,20 lyase [Stylophora pistillata]
MYWEALILVAISTVVYLFVVRRWSERKYRYPPGPRQLPLIGNLLDMAKFNHVTMRKFARQYGEIYMMTVMGQKIFVVTDIELAWDALIRKGNIFAGRPKLFIYEALQPKGGAIVFGDYGPRWKLLRKITHSALRMFGSGVQNLEEKVQREVCEMCGYFRELQGFPFYPKKRLALGVTNVIFSCLFDTHFSTEDEHLEEFQRLNEECMRLLGTGALLEVFPFMKYLPLSIHKRLKSCYDLKEKLLWPFFQEHKHTYKEGVIRDITDALITAKHQAEMEDSRVRGMLNENLIMETLGDLAVAGTDTTTEFLTWSLLYLASYPDIQTKIHQQLDDVIGRDRLPCFQDRSSLPYLEATISEIIRHSSFTNVSVPHRVRSNTTLGNHDIPENSLVFVDLRAIHHDPKHWKEPDAFDPTRFLDVEAGLLQRFKFEFPPDSSQPDLEPPVDPIPRAVLTASPYKLSVTERQ